MEEFKVLLGIQLNTADLENVKNQINSIQNQVAPIRIQVNDERVSGQIRNITNAFRDTDATVSQVVSSINNIKLTTANAELTKMKSTMSNFGFDTASITLATKEIEKMNLKVQNIKTSLKSDGSVALTVKGVDEFGRVVTAIRGLSNGAKEVQNFGTTISQSFNQATGQSKELINAYNRLLDITKRQGSIKTRLVGLDANQDVQEINVLQSQLKELQFEYGNLYATFGQGFNITQLEVLRQACVSVGDSVAVAKAKFADTTALEKNNSSVQRLLTLAKQMQGLELSIGRLDSSRNAAEISELQNRLESLRVTYNSLSENFDFNNSNLTVEQVRRLNAVFEETRNKLAQLDAKLADTKANFANGIQTKLDNGAFSAESSKITTSFEAIKNKTQEVKIAFAEYQAALTQLQLVQTSSNPDEIVTAYNVYEAALKKVDNQIKININSQKQYEAAQKQTMAVQQLETQKQALSTRMDIWLSKNSVAAKQFEGQIRNLQVRLKQCDATQLNGIEKEFNQITASAQMAGRTGLSTLDRLKKQFSQYSTYFSVSFMFMYAIQGIRSMYNNVMEVDTAMTELKKVTDETNASYKRFLDNSKDTAKEIGSTITGLVKSTADFARLGYGFNESQELAKVANIYAVVGDEVESVDDATQSLVSTMAAFKDEAQAINIIDKFNEVGNNFAISSGGIGEALQRSASSLDAANNSLDESIALITAANTVVQNPENVGTAFKTISMRIRGAKTELEDAGLETEGMVESTSKLREEILALSGVDIMLNDNEFKSTYKIMDELAQKWEELTDIQQAKCLPVYAEMYRRNIFNCR